MIFKRVEEFSDCTRYQEYIINTDCGFEKGIFLGPVIRKKDIILEEELEKWSNKMKKPINRFISKLIGNSKESINFNFEKASEDEKLFGIEIKELTFPLYFKRNYRHLTCYATGLVKNKSIRSIESYGYDSDKYNGVVCGGYCLGEKTLIRINFGKDIRVKRIDKKEHYHYTFTHIIKEFLKINLNKKENV